MRRRKRSATQFILQVLSNHNPVDNEIAVTTHRKRNEVTMPRDLFFSSEGGGLKGSTSGTEMIENVHSADQFTETTTSTTTSYADTMESPEAEQNNPPARSNRICPYVQSLTMLDMESCTKLEEATFPPQERCSREKFIYRLTRCGELSLGLFTSAEVDPAQSHSSSPEQNSSSPDPSKAITAATAVPPYSGTPARRSVLLGHVIATKTTNATVKDEDMMLPENWQRSSTVSADVGHQEAGRTICIHSLAVLPEFQGKGFGRMLLRAYIQRMESAQIADRIAIIAHKGLIRYYEDAGFRSLGESKVQFGGGGWVAMVRNDHD